MVSQEDYIKTREERVNFLKTIGLNEEIFSKYIPIDYKPIPDLIWKNIIIEVLKKLEKNEDDLTSSGFTHFAISGHTEGKKWAPWGMFDKSRYELSNKSNKEIK